MGLQSPSMAPMFEAFAKAFVGALGVYAALGLVFAVPFVSAGVQLLDPTARGSGIGFRLLILPGIAAFWPMLLLRWIRARSEGRMKSTLRQQGVQ
jgi:hypothetical protein